MAMTIAQAIARADAFRPNSYTSTQKIAWLSELDMDIYWRVLRRVALYDFYEDKLYEDEYFDSGDQVTFENKPYTCTVDGTTESPEDSPTSWTEETFAGYTDATSTSTVLVAPVPNDIPLYSNWLMMQMSLADREIDSYNAYRALYQAARDDLERHIIRSFVPLNGAEYYTL